MFSIHATKKILDRIGQPPAPPVERPDTALGNWYANALFWRPQVALLVSERTLFPVVMPLAPAATLLTRFPAALAEVLRAGGVDRAFIAAEVAAMSEGQYARTASRSILGSMNDFAYMAGARRSSKGFPDLVTLSLWLAETPCGPLRDSHGWPSAALAAIVEEWRIRRR